MWLISECVFLVLSSLSIMTKSLIWSQPFYLKSRTILQLTSFLFLPNPHKPSMFYSLFHPEACNFHVMIFTFAMYNTAILILNIEFRNWIECPETGWKREARWCTVRFKWSLGRTERHGHWHGIWNWEVSWLDSTLSLILPYWDSWTLNWFKSFAKVNSF